ncbi:hypothetical protein CC86DRAFT_358812 [Ophiobolus disseminans]|uniref:DUF6604 domain-containing protein n=1 Tax=Ophiobolus disseminans TaxID=1469910 RepID=A0A6A6ZLN8_9PLEO|nr:hypothetical protein CC86DRAFT_358812 [Ophiobolus disseminans]
MPVEIDVEEWDQEALFAMTMLMSDLSRMRAEIAQLLAKYSAGTMDLAAVSVATNTAIELPRHIRPLVDARGGITLFHQSFFVGLCQAVRIDGLVKQVLSDDYNYAAYDIADALFLNERNGVYVFTANVGLRDANDKWGWFDERSVGAPLSNREKYSRDKTTLQEVLQDLVLVRFCGGPIEDAFQRGPRQTQKAKSITTDNERDAPAAPIWLSFAAQLYLDTLYSVQIGAGWSEMRRTAATLGRYVKEYPHSCPELKAMLKHYTDKWESADPLANMSLARFDHNPLLPQYTLFRRNPMYCGLWNHYARTLFHTHAVTHAAIPAGVMYTTQLYHALRTENLHAQEWPDLQTVWNMQGNAAYFVGDPPTTLEAYFRNYSLTMGTSVTNWAPNKRSKAVKTNKANERLMTLKGPTFRWIASCI